MMNPFTLHQSSVIRETYKQLGREGEAESRVRAWYRLRDSFGSPEDPPHQRVRLLKQYGKERIYSEVLGNDRDAARLFDEMEAEGFTPTEGLLQVLEKLQEKGVTIAVVSESASLQATLAISRFLATRGLTELFQEVITPAGLFGPGGDLLDERFAGATKKSGAMYDKLVTYLAEHRIESKEAAMVGDDPILDVEYPKMRGFTAMQYLGVVDRGHSDRADYLVYRWSEFPKVE